MNIKLKDLLEMMIDVSIADKIKEITKENDELKEKVSSLESEVDTQIFRESGRSAKRYQIDETDNKVIIRRETIEGNGLYEIVGVVRDE